MKNRLGIWDNPENIDTLKRMWGDGAAASDIAEVIGHGVTRMAVIGKARRLKLASHAAVPRTTPKPMEGTGRTKLGGGRAFKIAKARDQKLNAPVAAPSDLPAAASVPSPPLVSLMDLKHNSCRFSFGEPRDPGFGFCGATTVAGTSWCEIHEKMVFRAP